MSCQYPYLASLEFLPGLIPEVKRVQIGLWNDSYHRINQINRNSILSIRLDLPSFRRLVLEWPWLHANAVRPRLPLANHFLEFLWMRIGKIVEFSSIGIHIK